MPAGRVSVVSRKRSVKGSDERVLRVSILCLLGAGGARFFRVENQARWTFPMDRIAVDNARILL